MARQRRLRLLANALRALGLVAVVVVAATATTWRFAPERVDALEAALTDWLRAPIQRALAAARGESEPARRAELYAALSRRLVDTEADDHHADARRECYRQLAGLAESRGDLAAATEWVRQLHEFDPRDLVAAVRYAELLLRAPATATDGRARLAELAARFPTNPVAVPALARHLLDRGRTREAFALLLMADAQPAAGLWTVACANRRADVVPRRANDALRFRFELPGEIGRWHLLAPPHRDLTGARAIARIGDTAATALADAEAEADRCAFSFEAPDGAVGEVRVELPDRPYRSAALAAVVSDPRFVELADELRAAGATDELRALTGWRLAALRGAFTVEYRAADGEFLRARDVDFVADEIGEFEVTVRAPDPGGLTAARAAAPLDAGFRLRAAEWRAEHGAVEITARFSTVLVAPQPARKLILRGRLF